VTAVVTAPEGSSTYEALVIITDGRPGVARILRLALSDDGRAPLPQVTEIDLLGPTETIL
jgi:hypothetical protein